jgi:enoyl-CoA hydratase/carnithine racemase
MTVQISSDSAAHVTELRIHRPEKKNALDFATYAALAEGLGAALADPAIHAIVLTGGPDVFTAGNDLGDFMKVKTEGAGLGAAAFLETLVTARKPIVAAVAGWAVGIGTTMLLHCDFIYAAPSAKFRTPFVELGLCPEAASTVLLPMAIGSRHAAEMIELGAVVDAAKALAWGLVNEVVEDPIARAHEIARVLADRPPGAMQATKDLLKRPLRAAVVEALQAEKDAFVERLHSQETLAAIMKQMSARASASR